MNLEELKERVDKNLLGSEVLAPKLEELEAKLQDPSVWADQKLATEIGQQVREIKEKISLFFIKQPLFLWMIYYNTIRQKIQHKKVTW